MTTARSALSLAVLLVVGLLFVACGTATPRDGLEAGSPAFDSPLSTEVAGAAPSQVPTATPAPLRLVVLHTNDNWGETEPCG